MTIQEAKDQAAKEWNPAFDYRALRNGVQIGNISMLHLDRVNDRVIELYANQFKPKSVIGERSAEEPIMEILGIIKSLSDHPSSTKNLEKIFNLCNTAMEEFRALSSPPVEQDIFPNQKILAGRILEIRDHLVREDIGEAYHALYQIADPSFLSTEPWEKLERLARQPLPSPPK